MKRILCLLLMVCCLATCFAACSKEVPPDNPVTDVNGAVDYGMTGALFGARWQEPSKAAYIARTMKELEDMLFEEA